MGIFWLLRYFAVSVGVVESESELFNAKPFFRATFLSPSVQFGVRQPIFKKSS